MVYQVLLFHCWPVGWRAVSPLGCYTMEKSMRNKGLGTYLWSAVYFKCLFWSFLPLNIWKLIMVLTHLIVSSELPVARNWPLLAAHLIQPACSFSAKIGFSLYCSTMNTKIIQLLFKSSLCGILSMWKLPQALPLHRQRQIRPKLVHRSQLRLPSVVPPWWIKDSLPGYHRPHLQVRDGG